jgi:hypothetical protein
MALFIFMLAPVAIVSASSPKYYIHLECDTYSYPQTATASISFLGHSYSIHCPKAGGETSKVFSFVSSATGNYRATMIAGGHEATFSGLFNQKDCEDSGYVYGPGDYLSYAEFWLFSAQCD